jgi:hypothetical protein
MTSPVPMMTDISDRRTQSVLDKVEETLEQMEIDHVLRQKIMEQVFESSNLALFRAVHSADFIERLIEISPSLTKQQKRVLRSVTDELIQLAREVPQDAFERGMRLHEEARDAKHKLDALEVLAGEIQTEWEGLKEEWSGFKQWLRK